MLQPGLRPQLTNGSRISEIEPGVWRLGIPQGDHASYRLAQLDDYCQIPRKDFAWKAGVRLRLQARASSDPIPGTWGFGFWNDPFSMSLLSGVGALRLPALPNAAWFFFASPPNYLSLDDNLPAFGSLAATFRSYPLWPPLLFLGAPLLPFALAPPLMRVLRRLGQGIIHQDAVGLSLDATIWHTYQLDWEPHSVNFSVDGESVFHTTIVPYGPLGLVLWIDNQYAAIPPTGKPAYGRLPTPPDTWIELNEFSLA